MSNVYIFLIFIFCMPKAWAMSRQSLCPKILESTGMIGGNEALIMQAQMEVLDEKGEYNFHRDSPIETFVMKAGKDTTRYTVAIETFKEGRSDPKEILRLDCPLVRTWDVIGLPKIEFQYPEIFEDQVLRESRGAQPKIIKDGFELVQLFPGKDSFFSLTVYWRLKTEVAPIAWPSVIADATSNMMVNRLRESEDLPVRGLRVSTDESFGNIWYLLTQRSRKRIVSGNREFLKLDKDGYSTADSATALSMQTARLEDLEFYDSKNKRFLPCNQALNAYETNSCFNFNYQLNPDLWEHLKEEKAFYVQVLVELKLGFLLQTYRVGDHGVRGPTLIRQTYQADLSELNIDSKDFED